ncbi:MAG: hypothetical protein OSB58_01040 [Alphaproteobacteria bacterium]|jgi:hypothetical protein|nr:hypothetical protein [Alphaproteobacteria bacterium]
MNGWQWFWTLVGFIIYIVVLIFLYFYKPFEDLFNLIINGLSYENAIFWAVVIVGIVGFCGYHYRAYHSHIVQQRSVESMVLSSLRGSTFIAILLSAGAALQSVQILCVYLLGPGYSLDENFGKRLAAVVALVILTGVFCIIFWLLKVMRPVGQRRQA